jgi:hypothetical protein
MKIATLLFIVLILVISVAGHTDHCYCRSGKVVDSYNDEVASDGKLQAPDLEFLSPQHKQFRDILIDQTNQGSFMFDDIPELRALLFKYHDQHDWPFQSTVTYLTRGYLTDSKWHYCSQESNSDDFMSSEKANVLTEGHCTSEITLSGVMRLKNRFCPDIRMIASKKKSGHCQLQVFKRTSVMMSCNISMSSAAMRRQKSPAIVGSGIRSAPTTSR